MEAGAGFAPSSGWVERTQVDLQMILELQIISNIVMETAVLWVGLFHSQQRGEVNLSCPSLFSNEAVEQLRTWK